MALAARLNKAIIAHSPSPGGNKLRMLSQRVPFLKTNCQLRLRILRKKRLEALTF